MKTRVWKGIVLVAAVAVLIVGGYAVYTVIHYMRTSPRFAIRTVSVVGLNRVEEGRVLRQAGVKGTVNLFAVDLEGVRERVEALRWVRYATVQRLLPDTIAIKIVERTPVGLARIEGQILQFDAQAELLDRDRGSGADFPILHGLTFDDAEMNPKKVEIYLRIMEDLHGKDELSEVQIDDVLDVSVISQNEPVLVTLGADHFRDRWGQYLQLRKKIQAEFPDTVQVDFRFKNQAILRTKVDDAPDEQKVLWDTEKKSL
jgi:cell division protein FtsQ